MNRWLKSLAVSVIQHTQNWYHRRFYWAKQIYLLQDQIELYNYRQTAAKVYYKMFREKLGLLEQSGLIICCPDKIEDILVNGQPTEATCPVSEVKKTAVEKTVTLEKHLISERDVVTACQSGANLDYRWCKGYCN